MLGEDVTTEVGHSTARVIMATLAATEGQLGDVIPLWPINDIERGIGINSV